MIRQFDVIELSGGRWAVNVQSDLIDIADTIVIIPLVPLSDDVAMVRRLNPVVDVYGERRILATHLLTVVRRPTSPKRIASLAAYEYEIKGALDLLVSGI